MLFTHLANPKQRENSQTVDQPMTLDLKAVTEKSQGAAGEFPPTPTGRKDLHNPSSIGRLSTEHSPQSQKDFPGQVAPWGMQMHAD